MMLAGAVVAPIDEQEPAAGPGVHVAADERPHGSRKQETLCGGRVEPGIEYTFGRSADFAGHGDDRGLAHRLFSPGVVPSDSTSACSRSRRVFQNFSHCRSHRSASSSGFASSLMTCVRPCLRRATSPAFSSTCTCLDAPAKLIAKGRASSLIDFSPNARFAR